MRRLSGSVGRALADLTDNAGLGCVVYKDTVPQLTLPAKRVQSEGTKAETARIRHYGPSRAYNGSGPLESETPVPPKTRPPGVTASP